MTLNGSCSTQRITNVNELKLPSNVAQSLQEAINADKMLWEAWSETANNVWELYASLKKRGCKVPIKGNPTLGTSNHQITGKNTRRNMLRKN